MGLLADNEEWRNALRESFQSSFTSLSGVFATILAYCSPSNPLALWEAHEYMFHQDIRARARGPHHQARRQQLAHDDVASHYVLQEIQNALQSMGRFKLADFELPETPSNLEPLLRDGDDDESPHAGLSNSSPARFNQTVRSSLPRLNQKLKKAFDQVVGSTLPGVTVDNMLRNDHIISQDHAPAQPSNRVSFLDAPGETGKTFLINDIQAFLELRDMKVFPVATSAVAAVLLIGGRTAHSTFKIPIPVMQDSTGSIPANSEIADILREVSLIIWDEVVMCHIFSIKAVDRTLRDFMRTNLPFGGKFVLFSGDFRQILPVVPGGSRPQIINACIKSSHIFETCRTLRLEENMRLQSLRNDLSADLEALQFPDFLLQVGEGRLRSSSSQHPNLIDLPPSVTFKYSLFSMCCNIYRDMAQKFTNVAWLTSCVILTTKNNQLSVINNYVGKIVPGRYRTYLSADKVENEDENALRYLVEMLNLLTARSALPEHRFSLKKGFIVMLLRNLDPENGYVNGTRYIVEKLSSNLLYLREATEMYQRKELCLRDLECLAVQAMTTFQSQTSRGLNFLSESASH